MKIETDGRTLTVSDITALGAVDSASFRYALSAALPSGLKQIDLDLSRASFVDCSGIGVLIGIRKAARLRNSNAIIRLINPTHLLRRLMQLTRCGELFRIERG